MKTKLSRRQFLSLSASAVAVAALPIVALPNTEWRYTNSPSTSPSFDPILRSGYIKLGQFEPGDYRLSYYWQSKDGDEWERHSHPVEVLDDMEVRLYTPEAEGVLNRIQLEKATPSIIGSVMVCNQYAYSDGKRRVANLMKEK